MTAKDITKALEKNYENSEYVVPNIYFFGHPYSETDFLVVQKNGYLYDIEIKISRADFKADFKKVDKHQILKEGGYISKFNAFKTVNGKPVKVKKGELIQAPRPNRFYYAVPEGLITVKELPKYAGLLYIKPNGVVVKIKEAPILTKDKTSVYEIFAKKFYYSYIDLKRYKEQNGIGKLNSYIKQLERSLEDKDKQIKTLTMDKLGLKYELDECKKAP